MTDQSPIRVTPLEIEAFNWNVCLLRQVLAWFY